MDSIDFGRLQRRARVSYEWARFRRAFVGFSPALALVAIAVGVTPRPSSAIMFGTAMFCLGVGLLWYGQDLKRAVLPGLAAGAVPLATALCANQIGHVCAGGSCMSFCLPACVAGGAIAGIGFAMFGLQGKHGAPFLLAGSLLAFLTGAMGCACIGHAGLLGLAAGYGVGLLSGMKKA